MKMPAITPGPWKHSPYRGCPGFQVWAGEPGLDAVLILEEGDADSEANAKAIAAVPQMIEALMKAREMFHEIRMDWSDPRAECREGTEAIDAALRLAGVVEQ